MSGSNEVAATTSLRSIDVDALAQEIRRVDGSHSLGAGALAEALAPYLSALSTPPAGEWMPIASAPKVRGPMIVVRGVFADRSYVTDPWCVFWQEGKWQRWPHDDPPTHWMPLPPLSAASTPEPATQEVG